MGWPQLILPMASGGHFWRDPEIETGDIQPLGPNDKTKSRCPSGSFAVSLRFAFIMITPCSHWLWSVGEGRHTIAGSHRLEHVTSSLSPCAVAPSIVLVIGSRQRSITYRRSRRQPERLCLDFDGHHETPLLLGTAALIISTRMNIPCCRPARENHPAVCTSPAQAEAVIYAQILYPFVDVICFYSKLRRGALRARWPQVSSPRDLPTLPMSSSYLLATTGNREPRGGPGNASTVR